MSVPSSKVGRASAFARALERVKGCEVFRTRICTLLWVLLPLASAPGATAQDNWTDKSPHKTGFITVNGVRLHYLDWGGKGETILFLHGLGDSAHIFDDIAPKFSDHFRVLALTRRGHGLSDKPQTGYETS